MKRDWDLVRRILFEIEEREDALGPGWINLEMEGHSDEKVSYHIMLLDEAGLIDAQNLTSSSAFEWQPKRLTWNGHEFLEAARDDTRWERAKKLVREKTGSLTFTALQQVLLEGIKRSLS